jgi:membrane associated rhomboid family serine protease
MAGSVIEEEWGTRRFVTLFAISTLTSAGVAAWLGVPLHGTYFVYYTLLFVYATAFPQQIVYIFGVIPVRSRLLALVAFGALVFGVLAGSAAHVAALAGALAGFFYSLLLRVRIVIVTHRRRRRRLLRRASTRPRCTTWRVTRR